MRAKIFRLHPLSGTPIALTEGQSLARRSVASTINDSDVR